jgi:hypothetical protein
MQPDAPRDRGNESEPATAAQFTGVGESDDVPAWEEIDTGRYMPRRTRGSFKGRALG